MIPPEPGTSLPAQDAHEQFALDGFGLLTDPLEPLLPAVERVNGGPRRPNQQVAGQGHRWLAGPPEAEPVGMGQVYLVRIEHRLTLGQVAVEESGQFADVFFVSDHESLVVLGPRYEP